MMMTTVMVFIVFRLFASIYRLTGVPILPVLHISLRLPHLPYNLINSFSRIQQSANQPTIVLYRLFPLSPPSNPVRPPGHTLPAVLNVLHYNLLDVPNAPSTPQSNSLSHLFPYLMMFTPYIFQLLLCFMSSISLPCLLEYLSHVVVTTPMRSSVSRSS